MMDIQNRYTWQATMADGSIITTGEDLRKAIIVSLLPQTPLLPRHDLMGISFVKRFGRGFMRGMGGGLLEYIHCVECKNFRFYVKSSDGSILITPHDYELYL